MKRILIFLLFTFVCFGVHAQSFIGTWNGELVVPGTKLPLVFNFTFEDNVWSCTMDSPAQGAKGIPIKTVKIESDSVSIIAPNMGLKFDGILTADSIINGVFQQGVLKLSLVLKRGKAAEPKRPQTPKPPFDYPIEEVSFKNEIEGNLLAGTLVVPKDKANFPIVAMITGSGAQNRDEEILGHKPFLVIADYLAKNGIGSLRLDDRGVGESEAGKKDPTSEDFTGDINSAVNFLKKRGFKNIGLLGHSEGGMIAPMVANINKSVKFLVLLAGPGVPIDQLMKTQTYETVLSSGESKEIATFYAERNAKLYQFVKEYKGGNFKQDLTNYVENNYQKAPFETEKNRKDAIPLAIQQLSDPWFQYFLKFDPTPYLSKLKVPVLALNGDKDVQVNAEQNLNGIALALKKAKNKKSKIVSFKGLNHLFQTAETGATSEYFTIEETIAPQVLTEISTWILELK